MANTVVVDGSHLLYNEFYGQVQEKASVSQSDAAAIIAAALLLLQRYRKRFKADYLIVAFDDKTSWRSEYTRRYGLDRYRRSRNKFKTAKEKKLKMIFNRLRDYFKSLLKKRPGVIVVEGPGLEADDLIAGMAQRKKPEDTMDIITLDKDTALLAAIAGVSVYFMRGLKKMSTTGLKLKSIERILRGRPSYSVRSVSKSLPRRLWNRFKNGHLTLGDLLKMLKPNKGVDPRVRYIHNKTLLMMTEQPDHIKLRIKESIDKSLGSQSL